MRNSNDHLRDLRLCHLFPFRHVHPRSLSNSVIHSLLKSPKDAAPVGLLQHHPQLSLLALFRRSSGNRLLTPVCNLQLCNRNPLLRRHRLLHQVMQSNHTQSSLLTYLFPHISSLSKLRRRVLHPRFGRLQSCRKLRLPCRLLSLLHRAVEPNGGLHRRHQLLTLDLATWRAPLLRC